MSWEFRPVAGPFGITEGPVWDGENVYFTDIPNRRIMRYHAPTASTSVYRAETGGANGLLRGPSGDLFACEMIDRTVSKYPPDADREVVISGYDGRRFNGPNDLVFDRQGRLWFTDSHYDVDWIEPPTLELDHDSVYRASSADGRWDVTRVTYDTTKPNGILFSPDERYLYIAQTDYAPEHAMELRAYPVDDDGTLGEYTVLHDFGEHRGIDGMCLDAAGNIVATAGSTSGGPGPRIQIFSPDGDTLSSHHVPDTAPTNCAFGGEAFDELFVTSVDGFLYRANTDRVGYRHVK